MIRHRFIFVQGGGRGGSRAGGGGIFGFGQSTAKIIKEDIGVKFRYGEMLHLFLLLLFLVCFSDISFPLAGIGTND